MYNEGRVSLRVVGTDNVPIQETGARNEKDGEFLLDVWDSDPPLRCGRFEPKSNFATFGFEHSKHGVFVA